MAVVALALVSVLPPTAVFPCAQFIALRSLLAVGAASLGLLLLTVAFLWRRRRRGQLSRTGPGTCRTGVRTAVVGLVLLLVAGAHGGVLVARGLRQRPVDAGAVSVLSLNTEREGADVEAVVGLADAVGADVLVLPETTQRYGRRLAEALTEQKKESGTQPPSFAVFSATGLPSDLAGQGIDQNSDPVYSTTVLVSSRLGGYRQVEDSVGAGFGTVRLEPESGDGPVIVGAHTYPPLPGAMMWWRNSVTDVASLCLRPPAGLIVAGDFNATRDHAPLRNLGGCASAGEQAGIGGLATWPSSTGTTLFGATIDHVLVDGTVWKGKGGRVVAIPGTDHRAVVVQLSDQSQQPAGH
ncbi:endonuclease/exonuclease/phosphatase family protein [Actinomyces naeslundii]|uniref:endonuclease/exonuclease/phosphatase family protein n=1 Tax=Actinomyces naeslundii TaxID=1655 RepID=UPI0021172567|nr:endonuclease/exonuclease/phosphatase family protein [Actinomyces naeslundii]